MTNAATTDSTTPGAAPARRDAGACIEPIEALEHFFILASEHDHSAARVAARLLLGLYNGARFPFDLTDLRLLDAQNLRRALALLEFDARPQLEVHQWLNRLYGRQDFGMRLEHLAHRFGVKGKCPRAYLDKVPALRFAPAGNA